MAISLGLEGPEVDAAVRVRDELARAEALVRVVQAAITTLEVGRAIRMVAVNVVNHHKESS